MTFLISEASETVSQKGAKDIRPNRPNCATPSARAGRPFMIFVVSLPLYPNSTQLYTTLHNSTQLYTTLHNSTHLLPRLPLYVLCTS